MRGKNYPFKEKLEHINDLVNKDSTQIVYGLKFEL